jgi:hypothetical protein
MCFLLLSMLCHCPRVVVYSPCRHLFFIPRSVIAVILTPSVVILSRPAALAAAPLPKTVGRLISEHVDR